MAGTGGSDGVPALHVALRYSLALHRDNIHRHPTCLLSHFLQNAMVHHINHLAVLSDARFSP